MKRQNPINFSLFFQVSGKKSTALFKFDGCRQKTKVLFALFQVFVLENFKMDLKNFIFNHGFTF